MKLGELVAVYGPDAEVAMLQPSSDFSWPWTATEAVLHQGLSNRKVVMFMTDASGAVLATGSESQLVTSEPTKSEIVQQHAADNNIPVVDFQDAYIPKRRALG